MTRLVARQALTVDGWRENLALQLGDDGRIAALEATGEAADVDVLLPAPANLHSHAFQRAMAGLTEVSSGADDFWAWRSLMYEFLSVLQPDDVEAIALGVQMEMLEAGYAAVGEFHYLHNAADGSPYDAPAELASRIVAAAGQTGIGLTLLPVLYVQGGLDGRPLEGGQRRFGADLDAFARIHDGASQALRELAGDARFGVAPHSLRAVPAAAFAELGAYEGPKHIHVAEQTAEVEAVRAATGVAPVSRLAQLVELGPHWTLIHATHASADDLAAVARSGATVGLCPITEANLGDGLIDAPALIGAEAAFGVGSDSNVRISLTEELRTLDYGQRLALRRRNPLARPGRSSGRALFEGAALGGGRALARDGGRLEVGALADLLALEGGHVALAGLEGDTLLDAFVFAADDTAVRHVWSAGRPVVRDGRHVHRDIIAPRFEACLRGLRSKA